MRKLLWAADDLLQNGRFISRLHLSNWTLTDTLFSIMVWTILLFGSMMILIPMNLLLGIVICALLSVPAAVTVCGMIVDSLVSLLKRPRHLSADVILDGELYGRIADRLKERGISNAKQYILAHPHYLEACFGLSHVFDWGYFDDQRYSVMSLVYRDDDPATTSDAIISIVTKRGVLAAETIEDLLEVSAEVQTPLREGAL